jgi:hypothetical protein
MKLNRGGNSGRLSVRHWPKVASHQELARLSGIVGKQTQKQIRQGTDVT